MRHFKRKYIVFCFVIFSISISSSFQPIPSKIFWVELRNNSNFNYDNQVVDISYAAFHFKKDNQALPKFKIVNNAGLELPYQLEYKGMQKPENILVQLSIQPHSSIRLFIEPNETPSSVIAKTYARFIPERFDDFAWENDRIAYRMYGTALNGRKDNAYGIDVWAKRTHNMIINKWYALGNYHTDNGEGLDFYGVGKSLGAGDIAPVYKDTIFYTNNFTDWKILDSGALRSTFQLSYPVRSINGLIYSVKKTITIDANSQLCKMEVLFDFKDLKQMPVAIGIVKRASKGTILLGEKENTMGYWEPEIAGDGIIGIGCVFPNSVAQMKIDNGHILSYTSVQPGQPFTYYFGAAWNKGGLIQSSSEWFNYLNQFSQSLKYPIEKIFSKG